MRIRLLAALLGVAATLVACGGGGKKTGTAARTGQTTTTTEGAAAGTAASDVTTSTTGAGTGGTKTTTPGANAPAAPAASGSATQPAANPPQASGGPAPAAPGKYTYNQKGEFKVGVNSQASPPQGTLTVDQPSSDGHQVTHRATDPNQPGSDTTYLFNKTGIFLESTHQSSGTTTLSCTFNPPIPTPPWPPTVGSTLAGHANCDPGFTTDVAGKVTGTKQVTLDGVNYTVYVVETTITTHGSVESTTNQVNWFSPDLRLSVHDESHTTGTYQSFSFTSDQTDDLVSGKPA